MVRRTEKRTEDQTTFIDQLCKGDPKAVTAYNLAKAFGSLLRNLEGETGLEKWKASVRASGITELVDFVEGLADDAAAVVNGCIESWSNGMVEGFVNQVKWIKRSSYGQAGFPLLQRRVLLHPPFSGNYQAKRKAPSLKVLSSDCPIFANRISHQEG